MCACRPSIFCNEFVPLGWSVDIGRTFPFHLCLIYVYLILVATDRLNVSADFMMLILLASRSPSVEYRLCWKFLTN